MPSKNLLVFNDERLPCCCALHWNYSSIKMQREGVLLKRFFFHFSGPQFKHEWGFSCMDRHPCFQNNNRDNFFTHYLAYGNTFLMETTKLYIWGRRVASDKEKYRAFRTQSVDFSLPFPSSSETPCPSEHAWTKSCGVYASRNHQHHSGLARPRHPQVE